MNLILISNLLKKRWQYFATGKCLFEDEDNLNFVNYWGEGFNGGKSDFLERFEKKYEYKTEELTEDENKLYNAIKKIFCEVRLIGCLFHWHQIKISK